MPIKSFNKYFINSMLYATILLMAACSSEQRELPPEKDQNQVKELYRKANRGLVKQDIEMIESYIERRGWTMPKVHDGLWMMTLKEGEGDIIASGDYITLNYRLMLLDGTVCYSSDKQGPKSFLVGQGGVEQGLEMAVLHLRLGSVARLIMLPQLGHGLIGDQNKIPQRAILLYEIEVIDVKKN